MDFLMNLIQLGLDAGILALCCEVVFRQKAEIKAKDFFVFPILLVLCVVPRVDFSIVCPFHYPPSNQQMAADFLCHIQHSRPNKIQPKMLSIVQICF